MHETLTGMHVETPVAVANISQIQARFTHTVTKCVIVIIVHRRRPSSPWSLDVTMMRCYDDCCRSSNPRVTSRASIRLSATCTLRSAVSVCLFVACFHSVFWTDWLLIFIFYICMGENHRSRRIDIQDNWSRSKVGFHECIRYACV